MQINLIILQGLAISFYGGVYENEDGMTMYESMVICMCIHNPSPPPQKKVKYLRSG